MMLLVLALTFITQNSFFLINFVLRRIMFVSKKLTLLYYYLYWYGTEPTLGHTVISKIINHIQAFLLLSQATVIIKFSYTAVLYSTSTMSSTIKQGLIPRNSSGQIPYKQFPY